MTKEEMINKIIERYKSYKNKSFINLVDCCGMDCENCPFKVTECANDVLKAIIDRFVKAEEKKETNLEHFRGNVAFDKTNGIVLINLINGWKNNYSCPHEDAIDWLLEPYKPPKPKYKLSKFEYDLLDFCKQYNDTQAIEDWSVLMDMQNKGHYKGISKEIKIRDILDNAEVITNE